MSNTQPPVIQWFRRDLRVSDNLALSHAAKSNLPVIPVYILSDWKKTHSWTGPNRQHFICESLASLAKNLETLGAKLLIRQGDAVTVLTGLIEESGAAELHYNEDPDPFGKAIELKLQAICRKLGVRCVGHADAALHRPQEILTQGGSPYRVYTPYSRNWLSLPKDAPLEKLKSLQPAPALKSLPLPTVKTWGIDLPTAELPAAGEKAARDRLKLALASRVQLYADQRNFPAVAGTSRISQDLRLGLISIRTVYAETLKLRAMADLSGRTNADVFIKELAWREFYFAIIHYFPNVLDEEFNPDWRGLAWDEPGEKFELWKQGRTGFPIVDAGMRELLATGFMHNRVRMITAMFLTKDLHIDWKLGESWFMQNLLDGEIASNNGGWQWSAGTGADAAPYFRIQNPWTQTTRYDPKGVYIKRWIPELANVHPSQFQEPPKPGLTLAKGYPLPCLDHKTERDRTLTIFKNHRAGSH